MPADRRTTLPTVKPVKTERTHEENQERAYIAASRRSDRSLEARIESARRASEIHKKRTGRALRVTEQDVVNEEMYEEEDEDLPTQYQRLNAHLQTSSWLFNRKLHDYIATQQGVRTMFMNQQFPGQSFQPFPQPFQSNPSMSSMSPTMLPPQSFSPTTPTFSQPAQTMSPHTMQQASQGYRAAPYNLNQRPHAQQRSASISTPVALPNDGSSETQSSSKVATPSGDVSRRLSLPARQSSDGLTAQSALPTTSAQQTTSPQPSHAGHGETSSSGQTGQTTPQFNATSESSQGYPFHGLPFTTTSFSDANPLSLSLPPESQQLLGSSLDPNDPRTAIFMAGSEHLAQPFSGSYMYNPNFSSKGKQSAKSSGPFMTTSMAIGGMTQAAAAAGNDKPDSLPNTSSSNSPPSSMMNSMFSPNTLMDSNVFDQTGFFDQCQFNDSQHMTNESALNDSFEDSNWVNWE